MSIRRVRGWAAAGISTVFAFVLAHQVTFLVTYGGEAHVGLERTGHGAPWAATVAIAFLGAATLAALALIRLVALYASDPEPADADASQAEGFARRWSRSLMVMLPTTLVLLLIEEWLEHAGAGLAVPGFGVLGWGDGYAAVPFVFPMVTALVAAVVALYGWHRQRLEARRRACQRRLVTRDRSRPGRLVGRVERARPSIVGSNMALRAPPSHVIRRCAPRVRRGQPPRVMLARTS